MVINRLARAIAKKYHDSTQLPLMVSPDCAQQRLENTMKNTNDDADFIVDQVDLFFINHGVGISRHSHSIVAGGLPEIS